MSGQHQLQPDRHGHSYCHRQAVFAFRGAPPGWPDGSGNLFDRCLLRLDQLLDSLELLVKRPEQTRD